MNSRYQDSIVKALAAAIGLGGFVTISSFATSADDQPAVKDPPLDPSVLPGPAIDARPGIERRRQPQRGDAWDRCEDARDAGTAPIYRGEPGYSPTLDKDGDGLACEPYSKP